VVGWVRAIGMARNSSLRGTEPNPFNSDLFLGRLKALPPLGVLIYAVFVVEDGTGLHAKFSEVLPITDWVGGRGHLGVDAGAGALKRRVGCWA